MGLSRRNKGDQSISITAGGAGITDGDKGDIVVSGSGSVWTIDAAALSGLAPLSHSHPQSDITGLVADLTAKAALVHTHAESDVTGLVADLAVKAALVHTHVESDITGLVADLAARPTGSGTSGVVPLWSSASVLTDSGIADDGSTITLSSRKLSDNLTTSGTLASFSMTGTGLTANGVLLDFSSSATYNTTAGALSVTGISGNLFGSRSAGANALTHVAGLFSASGAQTNVALRTNSGSNWFNVTDGTMSVGYAAGSAPSTQKLAVKGDATATAIGAANTATAQGSHTGVSSALSGTVSAAADRTAIGVSSSVTVTRASGAANAINKAGLFTASGGQINVALETTTGDIYLATTSGNVGIGFASAAALGAKLDITGTLKVSGAATLSSTLDVTGTTTLKGTAVVCDGTGDTLKFYGGTGATQQTVTGSRGGNAALADLLTKLATLGLIVDGTSA